MDSEIDLLKIEKRLRTRVKKQMEKSQREYYLNEQIKAIQKELGDMDENGGEGDELATKIKGVGHARGGDGESRGGTEKAENDVSDVG